MAITQCSECGHDVSSFAGVCPSCGVLTPHGRRNRWGLRHFASGVLVVLFVVAVNAIGFFDGGHVSSAVLLVAGLVEAIYGLRMWLW